VDHSILLYKLDHYGIRGKSNDWFRSYLNKRRQLVSVSGVNSSTKYIDQIVSPKDQSGWPALLEIDFNPGN